MEHAGNRPGYLRCTRACLCSFYRCPRLCSKETASAATVPLAGLSCTPDMTTLSATAQVAVAPPLARAAAPPPARAAAPARDKDETPLSVLAAPPEL